MLLALVILKKLLYFFCVNIYHDLLLFLMNYQIAPGLIIDYHYKDWLKIIPEKYWKEHINFFLCKDSVRAAEFFYLLLNSSLNSVYNWANFSQGIVLLSWRMNFSFSCLVKTICVSFLFPVSNSVFKISGFCSSFALIAFFIRAWCSGDHTRITSPWYWSVLFSLASLHADFAFTPKSPLISVWRGSFSRYLMDIRNASTDAYSIPSRVNGLG